MAKRRNNITSNMGIKPRSQNKTDKKALLNVLKQAFDNASVGGLAQINHQGDIFLLTKIKTPLQRIDHNGLPHVLIPMTINKDAKIFVDAHQKLLITMQKLNYEQKARSEFETEELYTSHVQIMERNEDLFSQLDELTFDFADGMAKNVQEQRKIMTSLQTIFDENPVLNQLVSGRVEK